MTTARDRLIVALDVPGLDRARDLASALQDSVGVYKIGLELLFAGGLDLAAELIGRGRRVFIDAKFLDITNTVERATTRVAGLGADFLTIHATDRRNIEAAVRGRGDSNLKLLAVTVMTHLGPDDLAEQGLTSSPGELVMARARMARDAGADGVIASGHEAQALRAAMGPEFLIVTPGIRPAGSAAGDQARITTPADAIAAGADYLVIGRPITAAADPRAAAEAIAAEIDT